jgi:uncharacterized protein YodC (DUF2158 family)
MGFADRILFNSFQAFHMNTFEVGDEVRLKTGEETTMFVEGFDEAGRVLCSSSVGVSRKTDYFPEEALEKIPPPKKT